MIRTWKTLAVAAVLAAVSPLVAVAGGSAENKDLGKKIDDLRADIAALTRKVDGLKTDAAADKASVDEVRRRLRTLEKALEAMQPPGAVKAMYPPPYAADGKSLYPPPPGTGVGRVLLRNNYGADVTLILNNGPRYRIAPFDTREIAGVPAGVLNYEVFVDGWGTRAARTTTLEPGRAVSLVVE